jgi:hypothetical protein
VHECLIGGVYVHDDALNRGPFCGAVMTKKNCLMVLLRRSLSTLTDLWVSASMQINDMEPCVERNSSKHRLIGNRRLACGWILAVKIRWTEFVEIPVRLAIVLAGSDLLASFSIWVASPWPMAWLVDTTGVVAVQVLWQLLQRQRCLFSSRITSRSMGPAMWTWVSLCPLGCNVLYPQLGQRLSV